MPCTQNYPDMHEPGHRPVLGGGPVVKTNANQSYATDGEGWARLSVLAQSNDIHLQHFVSRSDLPCGGTVGPLIAAWLGVRTVDVGSPMLAMHSVREMVAGSDVHQLANLVQAFFQDL
jgi:aspartyl aminopeptidase